MSHGSQPAANVAAQCPPWCRRLHRTALSAMHSCYLGRYCDGAVVRIGQFGGGAPTVTVEASNELRMEDLTTAQAEALAVLMGQAGDTRLARLLREAVTLVEDETPAGAPA